MSRMSRFFIKWLVGCFVFLGTASSYGQAISAPTLSVFDVDSDCFYHFNFNAPANTPSNYIYELYEKYGSDAWGATPTATRSSTNDTLPYYVVRTSNPAGSYLYRARICVANTTNCSAYSNEVAVTVTPNCPSLVAPSVTLSDPGALTAGQVVTLNAVASISSGTVSNVEFYNGSTLIGTDTSAPYSLNWTPSSAGVVILRAVANGAGGSAATSYVKVTIAAAPVPPTVSISSPSSSTNFEPGSSISISATASDTDGSISRVDFYSNGNLISSKTSSPYTISWAPAMGGYTLTAVATDNSGLQTTSAAKSITVGKPVITGLDVDADCYFVLNLNAPTNVAPNLVYEFYEKLPGASAFPATPTATRTTAAGSPNVPPFKIIRADQTPGHYEYRSRICLINTTTCGPYSSIFSVDVSATCQSVIVPTVNLTTPVEGGQYLVGQPIAIAATATTTQGSIASVSFNQGGTPLGVDTTFPYGVSWTPTAVGDYIVEAVADGSNGGTKTTGWITFSVVSNLPPVVSLTSPVNAAQVNLGDAVVLSATASDPNDQISKVVFYANDVEIGTDTTAPYQITNWVPTFGNYTIKAVATDAGGLTTVSGISNIVVGKPTVTGADIDDDCYFTLNLNAPANTPANQSYELYEKLPGASSWPTVATAIRTTSPSQPSVPPFRVVRADQLPGHYEYKSRICISGTTECGAFSEIYSVDVSPTCQSVIVPTVNLTKPVEGGEYRVGSVLKIGATATTTQGAIQSVTFNQGGNRLAVDTSYPYEVDWTPTSVGGYEIEAVADGTNGGTKSTGWVHFSVVDNLKPTVELTAPVSAQRYKSNVVVPLSASASDSDGQIAKVIFYANDLEIATDTVAPFDINNWIPPAIGNYAIKAVAVDNGGRTVTSSVSNIVISNLPASNPVVTGIDIDNDCHFVLNLNAPADVPPEQIYEFYEKRPGVSEWPATPTATRSVGYASPNTPPFRVIRSDQTPGHYEYKTRICVANSTECGGFSNVFVVDVNPDCQSIVAPSVTLESPLSGKEYMVGQPIELRATASTTDGNIESVTFNQGGTTLAKDSAAPYVSSWTPGKSGQYVLEAVADGTNGGTARTNWRLITVVDKFTPTLKFAITNQKASFNVGESINFSLDVDDPSAQITRMGLFANNVEVLSLPKTVRTGSWALAQRGLQGLKVGAYLPDGKIVYSEESKIQAYGVNRPTISISNPLNGKAIKLGERILLEANAQDSDNDIAEVQFFVNGKVQGAAVNQSPYNVYWQPQEAGEYSLSVKVRDEASLESTSATVKVYVANELPPPDGGAGMQNAFFKLATPNSAGVSYNTVPSFSVSAPLKIINTIDSFDTATSQAAKLIIISADTVSLTKNIELIGEPADLLIISSRANSTLSCYVCSFSNFQRVTFAVASSANPLSTSTTSVGELTTLSGGTISVNYLDARGSVSLEFIAEAVKLDGIVNTQQYAFETPAGSGVYEYAESSNIVVGSGGTSIFVGKQSLNYDDLTAVEIPDIKGGELAAGKLELPGKLYSGAVKIVSTATANEIGGFVSTSSTLLASSIYRNKLSAPNEGIDIKTLVSSPNSSVGFSPLQITGMISSDALINLRVAGDVSIANTASLKAREVSVVSQSLVKNEGQISAQRPSKNSQTVNQSSTVSEDRSPVIQIDSLALDNVGAIHAVDAVQYDGAINVKTKNKLQLHFGSEVKANKISLNSTDDSIYNGSTSLYRNDAAFAGIVPRDHNSDQLSTFTENWSKGEKLGTTSAKIIGDQITMVAAKSVFNINPSAFYRENGVLDAGVIENSSALNNVVISAERLLKIKAGTQVVNSSALIGVNLPPNDAEEGVANALFIESPVVINERYKTMVLVDVLNESSQVINDLNTIENQFKGLEANLYIYSPPGTIYSFAPVKFDFGSAANQDNTKGFLNNTGYFDVINDVAFTGVGRVTTLGLSLGKDSFYESSLSITHDPECVKTAIYYLRGQNYTYQSPSMLCDHVVATSSTTPDGKQVNNRVERTLFAVSGRINNLLAENASESLNIGFSARNHQVLEKLKSDAKQDHIAFTVSALQSLSNTNWAFTESKVVETSDGKIMVYANWRPLQDPVVGRPPSSGTPYSLWEIFSEKFNAMKDSFLLLWNTFSEWFKG